MNPCIVELLVQVMFKGGITSDGYRYFHLFNPITSNILALLIVSVCTHSTLTIQVELTLLTHSSWSRCKSILQDMLGSTSPSEIPSTGRFLCELKRRSKVTGTSAAIAMMGLDSQSWAAAGKPHFSTSNPTQLIYLTQCCRWCS